MGLRRLPASRGAQKLGHFLPFPHAEAAPISGRLARFLTNGSGAPDHPQQEQQDHRTNGRIDDSAADADTEAKAEAREQQ